ncbi:nicotinamide N-methyltransferase-like isoform X1 [Dendropsophus ebraccatus]|uniref:nicotinamide N-methyltransferase-like isoform X1 n=1 Tax=Dendropsophus ebraccatus TaxID=150705 RepID=UPI0038310502
MDRGDHKLYHVHGFDSRTYLETYLSDKEDMAFKDDTLLFPMRKFHFALSQGHIKGDSLIDISMGSFIHHLYSACDFFKEITILRPSERCVMEMNKWLHTRTGAFDWAHTAQMLTEITGDSDQSLEKDIRLKAAIKQIITCYPHKQNLTDGILPQADCVITLAFLDATSENLQEYDRNLKRMSNLLKPGGHLLLIGSLNASYYTVGEEKFHLLTYDEAHVKKALTDVGFTIDHYEVHNRKAETDLTNYEGFIFIAARKGESK